MFADVCSALMTSLHLRPLGSAQSTGLDFDHILLAQSRFWNVSGGGGGGDGGSGSGGDGGGTDADADADVDPSYVMVGLARLFARLVADVPYSEALPLLPFEGQAMYYEANIASAVYYKQRGVKLVLASFERLFGQKMGTDLRT